MNSKHLGDALDHWKGAIIERTRKLVGNIAVVPMITDDEIWTPQQKSAYWELLKVSEEAVLSWSPMLKTPKPKTNVRPYFQEIKEKIKNADSNLFLDPDTGIVDGLNNSDFWKYVSWDEIKSLLGDKYLNRVILVYQDARHGRYGGSKSSKSGTVLEYRVKQIRKMRKKEGIHLVTYDCGQVAMLFFSRSESRIKKLADSFKKMLSGDCVSQDKKGCPKERVVIHPS